MDYLRRKPTILIVETGCSRWAIWCGDRSPLRLDFLTTSPKTELRLAGSTDRDEETDVILIAAAWR
jgi:hypothetical protein